MRHQPNAINKKTGKKIYCRPGDLRTEANGKQTHGFYRAKQNAEGEWYEAPGYYRTGIDNVEFLPEQTND